MNGIVALTIGLSMGLASFGGLWVSLRQVIETPSRRMWVIIGQVGRLVLCAAVFCALSIQGIGVILSALGGFWIARWLLIRRLGVAAHGQ